MSSLSALVEFEQFVERLSHHSISFEAAERIEKADTVFLLAPSSFLGQSFTRPIAQQLLAWGKRVMLVDDTLSESSELAQGCFVIKAAELSACNTRSSVAINLSNTVFAHGYFEAAALRANLNVVDIVPVLDMFSLPVIYQPAKEMRADTLRRLNDYVDLARQLDDDFSVQTLGRYLEMRVTLDRKAVLPVLCSLEDEYFSPYPAGKNLTFELGSNEIFCDIGAHIGTTIHKFLTATNWNYSKIYAFEPDCSNFAALGRGVFEVLPNFHPKNIALSNTKSVLSFSETGTMGSRLDSAGSTKVQVSTLDDEVDHATFIKMDVEGHEIKILEGARRLISKSKPRLAITGYHFSNDLLGIAMLVKDIEPAYRMRLRHHSFYYYDSILYADVV